MPFFWTGIAGQQT